MLKICGVPQEEILSQSHFTTKLECSVALLQYFKRVGEFTISHLGSKNNLPSKKLIQKHWGGFKQCCDELGIYSTKDRWQHKDRVIERCREYRQEVGRTLTVKDFTSKKDMPSIYAVRKLFGSADAFFEEVFPNDKRNRHVNSLPAGISERDGKYRASASVKGRTKWLGTYDTIPQAVKVRDEYLSNHR